MTLREIYEGIGDYDRMTACIAKEESIRKFLKMFLKDENYSILERAMSASDVERAFYGAHTMKGVCQNLCLTHLYEQVFVVTEELRAGNLEGAREHMPELKKRYNQAIERIETMDE